MNDNGNKYEGHCYLVPQYDEYGSETSMEMLNIFANDCFTIFPNLEIDRDSHAECWHVYQYTEFEDERVFIGDLDVVYKGPEFPILRFYDESEAIAALAAMLMQSSAWSTF